MEGKRNGELVSGARELRRDMTKEEHRLWFDDLRTYPVRFSRQKILERYIADFYCAQAGLVLELDGSRHYEPEEQEKDAQRTAYLEKYSIYVVRIPNNEVTGNFRGVCEYIDSLVKENGSKRFPVGKSTGRLLPRRFGV